LNECKPHQRVLATTLQEKDYQTVMTVM